MGKQNNISESTSQKIDSEVRRLVESGLADATHILTTKKNDLESLAQGLLEYETLSGDEIRGVLKGRAPIRESDDEPAAPRPSPVPNIGKGRPKHGPEGGLEPQPTT